MWDNDWDCNGADRDPDPPEEQRERDIYDYIDDDR